jgi:enhancer of yellow 2 transcription factor
MSSSVNRPASPEPNEDVDFSLEDRIRRQVNATSAYIKQSILTAIDVQLIESGERDRLKALLRDRLLECGWKDEIKQRCVGEAS